MLDFELTRPIWLSALIALPVLGWYFHRTLVDFDRWQRITSLSGRALIVTLLVLALAGLMLLKPTQEKFVIVVVDRSLSIGDEGRKAVDEYVAKLKETLGDNRVAFLEFDHEPATVTAELTSAEANKSASGESNSSMPGPGALAESDTANAPTNNNATETDGSVPSTQSPKGTNLAAAIEVAAAAIPPFYVPEILLLTDGNQTTGDALNAALGVGGRVCRSRSCRCRYAMIRKCRCRR